MNDDAFRAWLKDSRSYGSGTVNSRVSNCKTVENSVGDLDDLFNQDQLHGLIARLTYSKEDERRNRPARHGIPINGNVYNGTATLRSAVSLYKQFRENLIEGTPILPPTPNRVRLSGTLRAARSLERRAWPTWDQPGPDEILAMAHLAMPFVRFLNPDVIHAVVEDNKLHRATWIEALRTRKIDPGAYLWEGSPMRFSGCAPVCGE